ncbi:20297_t:CDS:2, partial [Gigaspora margarita]
MYNEENSTNTNNNLSMEWTVENQTNINLLNIYNNPAIELSANFTQGYEDPTNNSLPTECQEQINNNLPIAIEWPTDFTNNNQFIEWSADFTQYYTNTSLPNINNNPNIESFAGATQNCENQINTLQQCNAKSVKKNKHSVLLVSRHERNTKLKCKKCLTKKRYYKLSDLCRECFQASLRILSGIKLIDDFIESTQTFRGFYNQINKQRNGGDLGIVLNELAEKERKGEIKFPKNRDTSILTNKINNQAIYSSRPLTPLISKALTLQSLKLNSNVIA